MSSVGGVGGVGGSSFYSQGPSDPFFYRAQQSAKKIYEALSNYINNSEERGALDELMKAVNAQKRELESLLIDNVGGFFPFQIEIIEEMIKRLQKLQEGIIPSDAALQEALSTSNRLRPKEPD